LAARKEKSMPDILHRVGINVKAAKVYEALTTIEGLRHWWTTETTGKAKGGGTINFGFCKMKVVEAKPGKLVRWKCVSGPSEWIGTEVSFQLKVKLNQTFVLFKHAGWREPVEFMHHCSTKWGVFMMSLKSLLETGKGAPEPNDIKIDNWN
jgi:uncharacterized protein YndB with AHSA1/START domain